MTRSNMTKPYHKWTLAIVIMLGLLGFYWVQSLPRKAELVEMPAATDGFSRSLARGAMAGVIIHPNRKPLPPLNFNNATGATLDLAQWKGRVVLLNLWATWCAPCRKEMPDLSRLQLALGGPDFEVVALSVDRKGLAASQAFLKEIGIANLNAYVEPEAQSLTVLQALGLPATVLVDRQGREVARILGPAQWASPEAEDLIKALMAEH